MRCSGAHFLKCPSARIFRQIREVLHELLIGFTGQISLQVCCEDLVKITRYPLAEKVQPLEGRDHKALNGAKAPIAMLINGRLGRDLLAD